MMSTETQTRYSVPFTPLEERIEAERPELLPALKNLKSAIGEADYEKYINTLASIKKVEDQLLVITRREMNRSIILSRFLPQLKESFDVRFVRVVNQ